MYCIVHVVAGYKMAAIIKFHMYSIIVDDHVSGLLNIISGYY